MRLRLLILGLVLLFASFQAYSQEDMTLLFPGEDGVVVELGNIAEISHVQNLTIEFWVNFVDTSPGDYFLTIDGNDYDLSYQVGQPWSELQVHIGDGTGSTPADLVYINEWFFMTMVFDGTKAANEERLKIYLNGIQQTLTFPGGSLPTFTPTIETENAITIGANPVTNSNSKEFNGFMDDLVIWSESRTNTEVLYDMNNNPSGEEANLVLFTPFDEKDTASIAPDLSGNGYTGTLTDFTYSPSPWYPRTYLKPAYQAHNVTAFNIYRTQAEINWINGSGSNRVVFMTLDPAITTTPSPADFTTYQANAEFGLGDQIGSTAWYCVYNGTATSTKVSFLAGQTVYKIMVCDYNGPEGLEMYNRDNAVLNPIYFNTNDQPPPVDSPTIQAQNLLAKPAITTADIYWTSGNGIKRVVFINLNGTGIPLPLTNVNYTANTIYGSGDQGANGWFCIYNGTESSVSITGLNPYSTYRVATLEYNSSIDSVKYLTTGAVFNPINFTTDKFTQTIFFDPLIDKKLSDVDFDLTATANSGLTVTYVSSNPNVAIISGSTVTIVGMGTTTITASQYGNSEYYAASDVSQNLTVVKGDQTISFAALADKSFGDPNFDLSATASSDLPVSYTSSNETVATIIGSTVTMVGIGSTTITASQTGNSSYNAAPNIAQTLTVGKGGQTISFAALDDKTYGDSNFDLTATASSGLAVTYTSSDESVATVNGATVTIIGAGTITITASQLGNDNYIAAPSVTQDLTVNKAELTVTADDKTKVYGTANPVFTIFYGSFVGNDNASNLATQPTATSTADASTAVGTASITASGGIDESYDFIYIVGTITITKATLTVTADDKTKTYGTANPSFTVSYSGFVGSDNASGLSTQSTASSTAIDATPFGTVAITASGGVDESYNFNFVAGTLTITKATLTITADDFTVAYGDPIPTYTYTLTAFVNGDNELSAGITGSPTLTCAYTITTPVSASPMSIISSANNLAAENYDFVYVPGSLTINKQDQTITFNTLINKTYGDADFDLTATASSGLPISYESSVLTVATISGKTVTIVGVGTTSITARQAGDDNYNAASNIIQNLIINNNLPTVTTTYASNISANNAEVGGNVISNGGDVVSERGVVYSLSATNANPEISGIGVTQNTNGTGTGVFSAPIGSLSSTTQYSFRAYAINSVGTAYGEVKTFDTGKLNQTITFSPLSTKTYGDPNFDLTATANSGLAVTSYTSSDETVATINGNTVTIIGVGITNIIVSQSGNESYNPAVVVQQSLTVNKAELTVSAVNKTKIYGAANPAFTVSYIGFVGSDNASSLTTQPTATSTADVSTPFGIASITASGGVDDNYSFTYIDGTLSITKATLTVSADNKTKVYGTANPAFTLTYSGFIGLNDESDLTTQPAASSTADATTAVGAASITASGGVDNNYDFIYVDGTLTITKATLTVIANDFTLAYGDEIPTFTYSLTGFANSENINNAGITGSPTLSCSYTSTTPVSASAMSIISSANNLAADNYNFAYTTGKLTITKATLVVTADNNTKVYGTANPAFTVSYSGFVGADVANDVTTQPTASSTADATTPVGTAFITVSGGDDESYSFTYVTDTLTITKATLTVTADNKTKIYGSTNPAFTVSYSDFAGIDDITDLTIQPTATSIANASTSVGTAVIITANGGVDNNYDFIYVDGTITITKATLTVIANDITVSYGDAIPIYTYRLTGFVNSEDAESAGVEGIPTLSCAYTTNTPVSSGPISIISSANDLAANNYEFIYTHGNLNITKATLSITADNKTKIYGADMPAFTISYSGFIGTDDARSLTIQPIATSTANTSTVVGTASITLSSASNDNYSFLYIDGILTITTAELTVTADDKTKIYGADNPAFTITYSGFVGTDDITDLTTHPTASSTADASTLVGVTSITPNSGSDDNYSFIYAEGILTITKAQLTVTADDKTKIYGSVNPVFTVSYSGFVSSDDALGLTTQPIATSTTDESTPVGTKVITPSGASDDNYSFIYIEGTLTITKAELTVTADDKTKIYGSVNPVFTVSYSGFSGSDDASGLTTQPKATSTADKSTPVGTAVITPSGSIDNNYEFTYVTGTLTITKQDQTISFNTLINKTFGGANFDLTATASSGLAVTYISSNETVATISGTTLTINGAGSTTISASQAGDYYYNAAINVEQMLTVEKNDQTISFDKLADRICGDLPFNLVATSTTGFAITFASSDETVATVSGTTVTIVGVGTTTITASQEGSTNYNLAPNVNQALMVIDLTDPVADSKDLTIYLDNTGNASITENDVNNYSTDECGIKSLAIDKSNFTCSDIGDNTVTLTVTDYYNNTSSSTSTVRVLDTLSPIIKIKALIVYLDETGNASIEAEDIDDGSYDNCGIKEMTLDLSTFHCGDLGENAVRFSVYDYNDNFSTVMTNVLVVDNMFPRAVHPSDTAIELQQRQLSFIIDSTEFDLKEVYDNCGNLFITNNSNGGNTLKGVELPKGINEMVWLVEDIAGNRVELDFQILISSRPITDVKLYPNPTENLVTLDLGDFYETITLRLTDLYGKFVLEKKYYESYEIQLDLRTYTKGVYQIRLICDEKIGVYKVIKL